MKENESTAQSNVPGRESGSSRFGQGTPKMADAVDDAVEKSNEADPY